MSCPLCDSSLINQFAFDKRRSFLQCQDCGMVFVSRSELLSLDDEKARYDLHDNSYENEGYVKYLSGMVDEIEGLNILNPRILDFGCGKEAVLEKILKENNYDCFSYDPVYNIGNNWILDNNYDVIIVCEVIEHIYDISGSVELIKNLLTFDGYLILRTEILLDNINFSTWWYKEDPTHVNFFTPQAIKTLAQKIELDIIQLNGNIVLMHKKTPL